MSIIFGIESQRLIVDKSSALPVLAIKWKMKIILVDDLFVEIRMLFHREESKQFRINEINDMLEVVGIFPELTIVAINND